MKTIIKIIVGILIISSMAFGKLEKMPSFKEYFGVSKEVILKDFGKPDIVESFGKEGDVIVFIKDDYNFENFFIERKSGLCTRHFAYYGVELLSEKTNELKKAYGEPKTEKLGRNIFKEKIRLSEIDIKNEDEKDFIKNGKAMSFYVHEFRKEDIKF